MKEREQKDMMYDQDEVNYTTLSSKRNQACANCRFFFPSGGCLIVECEPQSILPTGYCDEWTALPEPEDPATEIVEVLEAIEHQLGVNNMSVGMMEKKPTMKERLLALIGVKARDEPALKSGFKNFGEHQWIGWFSNNFEDLQGEYFPVKATDEFIARVDRKEVPMPKLYFWHVPIRFGEAKSIARVSLDDSPTSPSFTVAVGVYDDTPMARAFEKSMGKREYPMSHGFNYAPVAKVKGAYHYYDTFEVSPLPPYAPANPFTLFEDGKAMPILDERKRQEFISILGEDFTKEIELRAETNLKAMKEQGIGYKEIPLVDTEARAQLDALTKQMSELTEAVKAKMPMDEEDDAAKKKKKTEDEDAAKKSLDSVNEAIKTLATNQKQLADNFKAFLDMTPRRASKSSDTFVPDDDPALKELEQGSLGKKSNEDLIMNGAFGFMKSGGA